MKAVTKLELRWQLRWAWFQLGCRCIFNDKHDKIIEEPHCPVHGTQVTKNTWPEMERSFKAGCIMDRIIRKL